MKIKLSKAGKRYANGWFARVTGYPLMLVQLQNAGQSTEYWTASVNAVTAKGDSRKDAVLNAIRSLEMGVVA